MSWFLWDDANLKTDTDHEAYAKGCVDAIITHQEKQCSNTIRAPAICQAISKSSPCALICLFLAIVLERWESLSLSPFYRCGNQVTEWLSNWPKVTQLAKGILSPFPTNEWTPFNIYWGTVLSSICPIYHVNIGLRLYDQLKRCRKRVSQDFNQLSWQNIQQMRNKKKLPQDDK